MSTRTDHTDVAIIGAGPSGAIAAALLRQYGHRVTLVERQHFPRFSIGESLLPQCMTFIEEAGMLDAVNRAGFQLKNGAAFLRAGQSARFDFSDKTTPGPGTTFQVARAGFDQLLAGEAATQGADIRFGHGLDGIAFHDTGATLQIQTDRGERYALACRFVLDASGFGRVLPRLLDLVAPADFPTRTSLFTHIEDRIQAPAFDRDKILITVHPEHLGIWYWLIPLDDRRCSVGVVADHHHFEQRDDDLCARLRDFVGQASGLNDYLANAVYDTPVQQITGYCCDVTRMWGQHYALLGNAGEFLDPVFSSGVTIAMKSASLAAPLVDRQLVGGPVDWEREFARPLKRGVDTFRAYVTAWYDGRFQEVIFSPRQSPKLRQMICSILAGYAWDGDNPFVAEPERRLNALIELCRDRQPA